MLIVILTRMTTRLTTKTVYPQIFFHCVRATGAIPEEAAGCGGSGEEVSHAYV